MRAFARGAPDVTLASNTPLGDESSRIGAVGAPPFGSQRAQIAGAQSNGEDKVGDDECRELTPRFARALHALRLCADTHRNFLDSDLARDTTARPSVLDPQLDTK